MSPEDFYNSEERLAQLEKATIVQDLRHSYAFIFSQITQLWGLNFPKEKKLSSKSEDALAGAKALHDQGKISDYIFENIEAAGRQYVTLLPSELAKEKANVGEDKQYERLSNLKRLLSMLIGDLSEEISDVVDQMIEYDEKQLIRKYFK